MGHIAEYTDNAKKSTKIRKLPEKKAVHEENN